MLKGNKKNVPQTELFSFLDAQHIVHTTTHHEAVFTVEQSSNIKAHLPGGHTKNLFLKSKDGTLYLLCALGETQIPVNHLHKQLDCKRLSFGKPDLLEDVLGIKPGSVCLFALLNDRVGKVQLIIDQALMDFDLVNFHPLTNTATTTISSTDMVKFAKSIGHDPIILDFAQLQR